jgi:hypothetical protein
LAPAGARHSTLRRFNTTRTPHSPGFAAAISNGRARPRFVDCVLGRETSISVFDAQKTMEVCLAADRPAELGGQAVALPLIVA